MGIRVLFIMAFVLVSSNASSDTLKLLVLYGGEFEKQYSSKNVRQLKVQQMVNYTNQSFRNTNLNIRAQVVHMGRVDVKHRGSVSKKLLGAIEHNGIVNKLRDKYRPHLTIYITKSSNKWCGIANFPKTHFHTKIRRHYRVRESALSAISVVGFDSSCSSRTFAHEIGHNLGVGHGSRQRHSGKPYYYSRGHGVDYSFRTLMPYSSAYKSAALLQRYSNDSQTNCRGNRCGTRKSDAARGMQEVYNKIVKYYPSCYPTRFIYHRTGNIKKCGENICNKYKFHRNRKVCSEWE